MNKRQIQIIVVLIGLLLVTIAVDAKKWDKKDFDNLKGETRIFHLSNIQLAVNGYDFRNSLDEELGSFMNNMNNSLLAALPLDDLKISIEEKVGITIETTDYFEKFNNRLKEGFFSTQPEYDGNIATYNWDLKNKKNRLAITINLFKIGNRIRKNKIQILIQLLKYNPEKDEYEEMETYKSKRISWKKQTELYGIISNNCIVK